MNDTTVMRPTSDRSAQGWATQLKTLVGSGERIALVTLPVVAIGLVLNVMYPSVFAVGELSSAVRAVLWADLAVGIAIWAWSVGLILTKVPKGELITSGPYALVKHPLYTAVALIVIPAAGLLLGSWLGIAIGAVMYAGSRRYAPEEERTLSATFGESWDAYSEKVKIPWL